MKGWTGGTLQQTGGGEAATPALPSPREGVRRCTYEGRVRDAMAGPGALMRYSSGRELASFLRGTKAEIEELESLATTLPTGTFAKPLSDVFADLVGFVCQQMVPPLVQSAHGDTQAFLQGKRTGSWSIVKLDPCPVGFHAYKEDANPFERLWPQSPSSSTGGVPQKKDAQAPGLGKAVQTVFDKYVEALPLIDETERKQKIESKEFQVGVTKDTIALVQRRLDNAVQEVLGIFGSVPLNSENCPMTTYEEVIDLFGGHAGPDRCLDTVLLSDKMRGLKRSVIEMEKTLRDEEAELAKLLASPSEEERRQATFWCKAAEWLQGLTPVLRNVYKMEADGLFNAAAPSQPAS